MKKLALLTMLFTSCSPTVTGGNIVGKYTEYRQDAKQHFVLMLKQGVKQGESTGSIDVTETAWNQAQEGMTWPFEVKTDATTSNNQNGK